MLSAKIRSTRASPHPARKSAPTSPRRARGARTPTREAGVIVLANVNVLRHLASPYQQFMSETGVRNVGRLFVRLLHSDGHIPSWNSRRQPRSQLEPVNSEITDDTKSSQQTLGSARHADGVRRRHRPRGPARGSRRFPRHQHARLHGLGDRRREHAGAFRLCRHRRQGEAGGDLGARPHGRREDREPRRQ